MIMSLLYVAAIAVVPPGAIGDVETTDDRMSVVINEVMANPRGSESGSGTPGDRNEFIELYNAGGDTIDLATWTVTDLDADDVIIPWTDAKLLGKYPAVRIRSTKIPPRSYALIVDPEYTSTDTVGGQVEPYAFPESCLVVTVKNSTIGDGLANSDPVVLKDKLGNTVSTFGTPDSADSFPADAGDGKSWERTAPDAPDQKGNWRVSSEPSGSSPGRQNSTGVAERKRSSRRLSLGAPVPDPWSVRTRIGFFLPGDREIRLALYSVDGRRIDGIATGVRSAGFHSIDFVRPDLAAGVYFFVLETDSGRASVRTTVVR